MGSIASQKKAGLSAGALVLLLFLGCKGSSGLGTGGGDDSGTGASQCMATTCPVGCCAQVNGAVECLSGTTETGCGAGGAICQVCDTVSGQTCVAGACHGAPGSSWCNASTCPDGCCGQTNGAVACLSGAAEAGCGAGGAVCQVCDTTSGQTCADGACHGASGPSLCDATTCPTGCCGKTDGGVTCLSGAAEAACGIGGAACRVCDTALGEFCVTGACRKRLAEACSTGSSCVSGNCVDGVCCSTPTCKQCQNCGTDGICVDLASGTDDTTAPVCTGNDTCGSLGACKKKPGQSCSGGPDCASGQCVDGVCCSTVCDQTCKACNLPGSVGTCSDVPPDQTDENAKVPCKSPAACSGTGSCRRARGDDCTMASGCLSGFCVDGKCCNEACTELCYACNVSGQEGTCVLVPRGREDGSRCSGAYKCDGAGACKKGSGTPCTMTSECIEGIGCCGKVGETARTCGSAIWECDCTNDADACRGSMWGNCCPNGSNPAVKTCSAPSC